MYTFHFNQVYIALVLSSANPGMFVNRMPLSTTSLLGDCLIDFFAPPKHRTVKRNSSETSEQKERCKNKITRNEHVD